MSNFHEPRELSRNIFQWIGTTRVGFTEQIHAEAGARLPDLRAN